MLGKFFRAFFGILFLITVGCYIYYRYTGYSFGLNLTFLSTGSIEVTSTAFMNGGAIPLDYTCDGLDTPPPLRFEHIPSQTRSLALILEDQSTFPKAFNHWLVFNMTPGLTVADLDSALEGANFGLNDFGNLKYNGPCPPSGKPHYYYFKIYALDTSLSLDSPTRSELESAMKGHIIAQGSLSGVYSKSP